MKFLIVGLGSMGKRRIRCLKELGYTDITGFDLRKDRCEEAKNLYNIEVSGEYESLFKDGQFDAMIISVPPDKHNIYMLDAIKKDISFFVEASVLDTNMNEIIDMVNNKCLIAAPSATMLFHPAIIKIKEILDENYLGKISNFTFHSGQFLKDWHTYEDVKDFYVSNKETGGAREIVPFELTWITSIFGSPKMVYGNVKKTIEIKGAENIDDTYNFFVEFENLQGVCTVDVVSRNAVRRLMINGEKKQLIWDWNKGQIDVYDSDTEEWEVIGYDVGIAEGGYNKNIGERMYIDEVNCFIQAVLNKQTFINTLEEDLKILQLLYAIEKSSETNKAEILL